MGRRSILISPSSAVLKAIFRNAIEMPSLLHCAWKLKSRQRASTHYEGSLGSCATRYEGAEDTACRADPVHQWNCTCSGFGAQQPGASHAISFPKGLHQVVWGLFMLQPAGYLPLTGELSSERRRHRLSQDSAPKSGHVYCSGTYASRLMVNYRNQFLLRGINSSNARE